MGHSVGDGLVVAAIAGAIVAYLYFKHVERRRRLEIVHTERIAAMDKGIPLPELPLDPPPAPRGPNPHDMLIHGIAWTAFGGGGMLALALVSPSMGGVRVWPLPLPLLLLGVGFILYYVLGTRRPR